MEVCSICRILKIVISGQKATLEHAHAPKAIFDICEQKQRLSNTLCLNLILPLHEFALAKRREQLALRTDHASSVIICIRCDASLSERSKNSGAQFGVATAAGCAEFCGSLHLAWPGLLICAPSILQANFHTFFFDWSCQAPKFISFD